MTYQTVPSTDSALLDTIQASLVGAYGGIHATDAVVCSLNIPPHPTRTELGDMAGGLLLWSSTWSQVVALEAGGRLVGNWGPALDATTQQASWTAIADIGLVLGISMFIEAEAETLRYWFSRNGNPGFDLTDLNAIEGLVTIRFAPGAVTVER